MDTDDLVIRDARREERDAIRALTLQAYEQYAATMAPAAWEGLSGAIHNALEVQEAERIVAERGGRLLGSVMLFPRAGDAYRGIEGEASWPELRLLAVAPEARGQGVGEALVEECIRRARQMGATELGLHTSESMAAAMRMYRRIGFVRAPEHDFQPEGAEVVEAYRL
ncbi:MAG TPA: GNAT family N-acetyltransferase, partial [Longimicrobium sp.]|nr:GNAT family N-acetyltransferase [Longimicrobium sp.]